VVARNSLWLKNWFFSCVPRITGIPTLILPNSTQGEKEMQKLELVVTNEVGLHARPAAVFVQTANKYASSIKMRNITNGREFVDAKSILGVLILGVGKDHTIEIEVEGCDEVQAAQTLKEMIESDLAGLL